MKYDVIDYGVTIDFQKKSFIEPAESCSHSLIENYIMKGARLSSPEIEACYLKHIFPNKLSNTFSDFFF